MSDDFEKMLSDVLGPTQHDAIDRAIEQVEPEEDVPEGHRSGFVAVVGRPNVGKSTLLNHILGEKVAIVSPKPGTTRIQQMGILTEDTHQIIFVDTPGFYPAQDDLGKFMISVARSALADADVILFVTDASESVTDLDRTVAGEIEKIGQLDKVLHVMNKVDAQPNPEQFKQDFEAHRALLPDTEFVATVATKGKNVPKLVEEIIKRLPEGPRYYPREQVSDIPVRGIAAELIREQVLNYTEQEVPHSIAVEVDEFKRRRNNLIYIHATIFVERDGQKGIIIGKGGRSLKRISTSARAEIERFLDSKVYLEILVKVLPNWRRDEAALKRFGYRL